MTPNAFTIHATATFPSMDHVDIDWVRDLHVNGNGWSDVGYHVLIKRDGTREYGRPMSRQGAHVGGYNTNNLGIAMAGGLKEGTKIPEDNFTAEQYAELTALLKEWHEKWPEAKIVGHNFWPGHYSRGCPCFDWKRFVNEFMESLNEPVTFNFYEEALLINSCASDDEDEFCDWDESMRRTVDQ